MEQCPYCNFEQKINEDGEQYEVDRLHEHQCINCEKTFTFTTYISFSYQTYRADCLNGEAHNFEATYTIPIECTKMRCADCEETREPTPDEWILIKKSRNENTTN